MNQNDQYEQLGKQWLAGDVEIETFAGYTLTPNQKRFINDKSRMVLANGGFAAGKSLAFIIKLYLLCMFFPNNRILLGRKSRVDVEQATLPDIMDIFPEGSYTYRPGPGIIEFPNGSQILIYGLDVMSSGASQDTKKSVQKIKSLNLGGVAIDQLEEIEYVIIESLTGRLRRDVPLQQMFFTGNPANYWAYDFFKANPRPNTSLIEFSMMDNKANLSEAFIDDQLNKPKIYVDKFVYGIWDPTTLVEGTVYSQEYIDWLAQGIREPIREFDGICIYENPSADQEYQVGVDPSLGAEDPCHIVVVSKTTGEEVANYSGFVPNNVVVQKAFQLATLYSIGSSPLVIPEVTGAGQAFIEEFKKIYDNIYIREVFNHRTKKKTQKLGFYTNFSSKTQLIEHFRTLLSKKYPVVRDRKTVEESRTFCYSDEASKKGAGAQPGFHDDRIMAKLLAYWGIEPDITQPKIPNRDPRKSQENEFGLYTTSYR